MKKFKDILDTGRITRYHATMIDKKQSVAEHSWGVAVLLVLQNPKISREALIAALFHDCGEALTGDIPSPVKRLMTYDMKEQLKALEQQHIEDLGIPTPPLYDTEQRELKIADCLEGLYYCEARIKAGDKEAIPIRDKYLVYLGELGVKFDECK